jgi:hypothetical protein
MTKTTKIILLSTGGLIMGVGAFLGVRYIIRNRKKKREQEQARLLASTTITPTPSSTGTGTGTGTSTAPSGTGTSTAPAGTSGTTNVVTSSGVPVVMASYTTLDPTTPATPTYNPNSVSFKRLDAKLKSLYRMMAWLDRKDGKLILVEADDFKPEKPNQEVRPSVAQFTWREGYNGYLDVLRGFGAEEKDNPTKAYGNMLIDIFKKQRLDYLFPPKTADGKDSVFSPTAKWYIDAQKLTAPKDKVDFWKTN